MYKRWLKRTVPAFAMELSMRIRNFARIGQKMIKLSLIIQKELKMDT